MSVSSGQLDIAAVDFSKKKISSIKVDVGFVLSFSLYFFLRVYLEGK